jgi:exodeoxyribonuclease-5
MILTKKQEQGLMTCIEKYINGEKYCVISGYAGAGKSTLVKFIVQNLPGIDPEEDVVYACYTGKAAQVLLKKGNKNVLTLHKLLYESVPKPDGTFFRIPKATIDYKVVIVDEVSMAPKKLMELLFSHNVFIIALGDPFQLPPVDKNQDNGLLNTPDVFLDEIMRQALDSEIIRLSMQVRNKESFDYSVGSDVIVMPKKDLNTGVLKWADQILVGTNATRVAINNQMRDLMGRGNKPENGDKVICLRNYWDYQADNYDPLVNGTIGYINDVYETYNRVPGWAGNDIIKVLKANFTSDSNANFGSLQMDEKQILTGERCLDYRKIYKLTSNRKTAHLVPMEFTYGYAITYWKAQGSEWDNVVVLEESFPYDAETHARAMYTAITRASNKLVWVR